MSGRGILPNAEYHILCHLYNSLGLKCPWRNFFYYYFWSMLCPDYKTTKEIWQNQLKPTFFALQRTSNFTKSCPVDWERVFAQDNVDDVANTSKSCLLLTSEVFPTSQLCNTIVLVARKMETLFGTKFKTFGLIYSALWMFYCLKPIHIKNQKIINYHIRTRNFLLHRHMKQWTMLFRSKHLSILPRVKYWLYRRLAFSCRYDRHLTL